MRLTRRNAVLGGVLLVLGLQAGFAARGPSAPANEALVPDVVAATRLDFEHGTERVELVRAESGWLVASAHDFPAYSAGVERFLRQLAGVRTGDAAAEQAELHTRLGVGDDGVRVLVDGSVALVIGESRGATYVRRADGARVWRAPTLSLPATTAAAWVEPQPFRFDPSAIVRIRANTGPGAASFELVRAADGRWLVEGGGTLAPALVTDWLRLVGSLVVDEVRGLATEPEGELTIEVELEDADGLVQHVLLSQCEAEGRRAVRDPRWNQRWRVLVAQGSATRVERGFLALARAVRR